MSRYSPRVDLLYGGRWHNITDDPDIGHAASTPDTSRVREAPPLTITRGRRSGQPHAEASTCDITISDRDGKYSRRNPRSALRGKLARNTGMRASNTVLTETFTGSTSNGWSTADTGQTWLTSGGVASAYSSGSGYGSISISALSSNRYVYTTDLNVADIVISTTFKPGAVATAGGAIFQRVMFRRVDALNFYHAGVIFLDTGVALVTIVKVIAGSSTTLTSSPGAAIPYVAGSELGFEVTVCGNVIEARVWDVGDDTVTPEVTTATDTSLTAAGAVGVIGAVTSGSVPKTVQFGPISMLDARFCGELPSLPHSWDPTGRDVHIRTQAAGVMRRLSQAPLLRSAIRRYLEGLDPTTDDVPVAYWPMEEGPRAARAEPVYGRHPLLPIPLGSHSSGGTIKTLAQWGKGDMGAFLPPGLALAGNAQLAVVWASVKMGTNLAGSWVVEFAFAGTSDTAGITLDVNPTYLGASTSGWPQVILTPSAGTISVAFNGSPETTRSVPQLYDGLAHWIRWEATISGANTTWEVTIDGESVNTGTEAGYQVPGIQWVAFVAEVSTGSASAISNLVVWDVLPTTDVIEAGMGWPGEPAGERFQRLCAEEGITAVTIGDPAATAGMGPQRLAPLLELVRDCETTDQGILYEPRALAGLAYRTRKSLETPTAALALTYTDKVFAQVPTLDESERNVSNEVRAADVLGGAETTVRVTGGALGSDQIGTYQTSVSASVGGGLTQLEALGAWVAHLSTFDEERWTEVRFDLTRTAVSSIADDLTALDMGDMFTVDGVPGWLAADQVQAMIVGATEELTAQVRRIGWNSEPSRPYNIAELDHTELGLLDSGGSTVAAAFNVGTDTSLSVAVATGYPLWQTGAADFDLSIGGVRLHVTNIAGASSPQTFTVNAAPVNDSSGATLAVGEEVHLYRPGYIGLGGSA